MLKRKQAAAPPPQRIGPDAFSGDEGTTLRWLGGGGAMINSRGTVLLLDPVLLGFDMPLLAPPPLDPGAVSRLDGILITHCDGDHFSEATCKALSGVCPAYHSTRYVSELLQGLGLPGTGHEIRDSFCLGQVRVTLTPADHAWQNELLENPGRIFQPEDCCGYWLDTPDGSVWAVGDSRLLEEHLHMPAPDAIFLDFSQDSWHIGLEGAAKLAAAYPQTPLLLWHWGTVDAPEMAPFNGDPADFLRLLPNPRQARILAPGEPFPLRRIK